MAVFDASNDESAEPASVVVYVDEDDVVRTNSKVPSCNASIMLVSNLPHKECVKAFRCVSLVELEIHDLLKEIPAKVSKLTKLSKLKVLSKDLVDIADEINQLKNLRELHIVYGHMYYVPLGGFENVEVLYLCRLPRCYKIPERIGEMKSLTSLSIFFCKGLQYLPTSFRKLVSLRVLILKGLPDFRFSHYDVSELTLALKQLEQLELSYLEDVQPFLNEIENLSNLNHLTIVGNEIESFPASIGRLTKLKLLCLHPQNFVKSLPDEIWHLPNLEQLEIINFRLMSIPKLPKTLHRLIFSELLIFNFITIASCQCQIWNFLG